MPTESDISRLNEEPYYGSGTF